MSQLSSILQQFSFEQQQDFVRYLKSKNRRSDTKNVQLAQLLAAGKTVELDLQLYGKPSKNAYHALRNRLQDSVIDFTAVKSFDGETSEELDLLKRLLAARIFFERKQNKIALKTLAKAEKLAIQYEVYAILTEIYHTKIQYAHLQPSLQLEDLIAAANLNLANFVQEQHLAMAYATIKARLQKEPTNTAKRIIVEELATYAISPNTGMTFKSLFQLMEILVTAAQMNRNYYEISKYMNELYVIVSGKEELAEKHLFYHIKILYLMALTYFRNKDFITSLKFTSKMKEEMSKQNGKYATLFEEKWMLLQSLNLNFSGNHKEAILLLKEVKPTLLDGQIALIMCYFQQSRFNEGYGIFKQMNHSDAWYEKKMGWAWVVKKSVIEILLLIELDKLELVLSRLQSFKKRFSKKLKMQGESRVLTFINLVSLYYENPKSVTSKAFEEKVESSFDWIDAEREDLFVMSFYAWLKAKMNGENLYKVTLGLVNK